MLAGAFVTQNTPFKAQAAVLACTASVARKNALPDHALPTRNVPTTVKPCLKPDSCRPKY